MNNDKAEKSQNNSIVIISIVFLLALLILFVSIAFHDRHVSKCVPPIAPDAPGVTSLPIVVLPIPEDTNTKNLYEYTSPTILIIPSDDYPVISENLVSPVAQIIKIEVFPFTDETGNKITYVYTSYFMMLNGELYYRVRTIKENQDVVIDTDWRYLSNY